MREHQRRLSVFEAIPGTGGIVSDGFFCSSSLVKLPFWMLSRPPPPHIFELKKNKVQIFSFNFNPRINVALFQKKGFLSAWEENKLALTLYSFLPSATRPFLQLKTVFFCTSFEFDRLDESSPEKSYQVTTNSPEDC